MAVDSSHSVLRSAKVFFAGTVLSRISGLLRDIAMAISFGSSAEIAAFMVAYRLANLFRRLLGEGNLQAGFVPHFTALKEQGIFFYRDAVFSMGVILCLAVLILEAILGGCTFWVSSGWIEIVELAMWMVPGLFFICLYGLNSALLQCQKRYFLPAVAPVAFNLIWIGAVLFRPNIWFLSLAITLAFAAQWLTTAFAGASLLSLKEWLRPKFFSPDFKGLLKPLLLGIVGIGAVQFNSALDAIFARLADLEWPAFLWYAIRIQQLPLALFGIALSGALLPPLSRAADPLLRRELLISALRHSATLMLFCTFALFALAPAGVNLLYGHGDFTPDAVRQTSRCLCAYGLGLIPSVFVLLLATRFYAEKDYRTPSLASLWAVGANLALNALFVFGFRLGAVSIALATSLSSWLNMALLARGVFTPAFGIFFGKMILASAVPALATLTLAQWVMDPLPRSLGEQLLQFATLSAVYLGSFAIIAWRLKLTDIWALVQKRGAEI